MATTDQFGGVAVDDEPQKDEFGGIPVDETPHQPRATMQDIENQRVKDQPWRIAESALNLAEPLARNFSSDLINTPNKLIQLVKPSFPNAVEPGVSVLNQIPEPQGKSALAGAGRLGVEALKSMTTPEAITTFPALGESALVRAGLALPAAYQLPEQAARAGTTFGDINSTPAQKVIAAGEPALNAAMIAGLGAIKPKADLSGLNPEEIIAPQPQESNATPIRENQGQLPQERSPVEGSQTPSGNDLEQAASQQPEPVDTGETKPQATLNPHYLQPALKFGNEVLTGGESHNEVAMNGSVAAGKSGDFDRAKAIQETKKGDDATHGFTVLDESGNPKLDANNQPVFISRDDAGKLLGKDKPLNSEDLKDFKEGALKPGADKAQTLQDLKSVDPLKLTPGQRTLLNKLQAESSSPIKAIQDLGATDSKGFNDYLNKNKGLTKTAWELGQNVKSPEEVSELKNQQDEMAKQFQAARAKKDFNEMTIVVAKGQFFREAHEAATGTGSAGLALKEANPNYKAPFPVEESPSTTEGTKNVPSPEVSEPVTAQSSKEPLGMNRPSVQNQRLRALSDDSFDSEFLSAKKGVNEAEKMIDQVGDIDQLTPQQRKSIGAAQDRWEAADLERFRRNIKDTIPEDLFYKLKEIAGRAVDFGEQSSQHQKAKLIMEELQRQGATPEEMLAGIKLSSPDAAEVFKSDLQDIQKLSKLSVSPTPKTETQPAKAVTGETQIGTQVEGGKFPQSQSMGGALHGGEEFSLPTMEDQISGKPLAPKREDSGNPTIEPQNKSTINSLSDVVKNAWTSTKGFLGGLAGKTFPKTTLISKRLGELGARWISSKIAARPKAELFVAEVLGDSGLKSRDVGAALTEDNLRSIKKAFEDSGDTESASKVQTLIGKKGSPFKTEREYQDFLSNPKFKEVVERHKDMWKSTVEPQYIAAMRLDPDTELPSRGLQTGARINLRAVQEGENPKNVVQTVARGNLLNTLRKKSPFGIQATGTGEVYHTDLHDLMENTFGRQDEIANKNEFEKALVDSGNAVEGKPGQQVVIDGRPAVGFPLQRKTVIVNGKPISQNRTLYVNSKIASEYRIGANVDFTPPKGIFSKITNLMNQSAIASATEASTHVMNLGSALFALPGTSGRLLNDAFLSSFGRVDIPVKIVRLLMKSMQDNRAQIAGLSEIGAMRGYHEPTKIPVMRQASQLIQWMDKNTRLVLDDAYNRMRADGLVDPSETSRREFVNQVGQYNSRAQPYLMGQMRKLGISPFVTAGKNFNTLGIREATLNPGVKATSPTAALALRANMLSKWIGVSALLMTANYLLTKNKGGGVMGRKGTPIGYIDTGEKDKNGRNILINVLGITGQGRALRVTGLKGFIDSERMGLGSHTAMDTASRDMINSAISPWAGPLPRFIVGAASGYPTAVNVGREFPVTPPGSSQHVSDFKNAVIQMNPVVAGIHQAMQPNSAGWIDAVRSQFPRLVPQAGKADSMTANYPEIVEKAQANDFINDVIHKARTVPLENRKSFVESQIKMLPAELRQKAEQEMIYRRVYSK